MRSVLFIVVAVALTALPQLGAQPGPGTQTIPQTPGLGTAPNGAQVCAREMKATTKVVHGSAPKMYCQPHFLPDCIRSCLGLSCGGCDCGTLRTYNVLTKKVVPGPDVPVCRVKDLSAPSQPPGASAVPGQMPPGESPKAP